MKIPSTTTKLDSIFKLFEIPVQYNIYFLELKKKYFEQSKRNNTSELNKAYELLKDDYKRAQLFNSNSIKENNIICDKNFLNECLMFEEKIKQNQYNYEELSKLTSELDSKISICKENYDKPQYLTKWSYYKRLKDLIDHFVPN